jgi:hypothetical protein
MNKNLLAITFGLMLSMSIMFILFVISAWINPSHQITIDFNVVNEMTIEFILFGVCGTLLILYTLPSFIEMIRDGNKNNI